MMRISRNLRPFLFLTLLLTSAGVPLACSTSAGPAADGVPPVATNPAPATQEDPALWTEFDRLIQEGKVAAAQEVAERRLQEAYAAHDDGRIAGALIRRAQARIALSGFETAASELRAAEMPASALYRTAVDLFYGHALVLYSQAYSWEIQQRERRGPREALGIEAWTREQIRDEAVAAYLKAWQVRGALGELAPRRLAAYLEPNNYPPGIRGTLRDSLTYFLAELLSDSSLWSPRQSSAVYRLELDALLAGDPADVTSDEAHPLERMAGALADLEGWHRGADRPQGALEAALERHQRLFAAMSAAQDRARIRRHLEARLAGAEELPWWSNGMATLASMLRQEPEPDRLMQARDVAARGAARHPGSLGAAACRQLVEQLEAADFRITAMSLDAPDRRSVEIQHRNVKRLWLRAYPIDLVGRLRTASGSQLFPAGKELRDWLAKNPAFEWQVDLAATPDLRHHRTFYTPGELGLGAWILVASDSAGFRIGEDTILSTELILSDMVLLTETAGYGAVQAIALSGGSGEPLAGLELSLHQMPYGKRATVVARQRTDARGRALFTIDPETIRGPQLLVAERDGRLVFTRQLPWGWQREEESTTSTLLYTDRSIYRPGQTLHFKALLYESRSGGEPQLKADDSLTVSLYDPNGEQVASTTLSTNRYGTAGDSLVLPAGRPLGSWRLESSRSGTAYVQVEEYKRPSFEVEIPAPAEALRLNRAAQVGGEARYLFGLPVTSGTVAWRVQRQAFALPWWYFYARGGRPIGLPTQAETIAAGESRLDAEGRFEITFMPQADERLDSRFGLVYSYSVEADVTDEAGETRSAERTLRIGLATVEAEIESDFGFLLAGEQSVVRVRRQGLNGQPAPGAGRWRLSRLDPPAETLLPAEQPLPPIEEEAQRFATAGDRLRPRWDSGLAPRELIRGWPVGEAVADGEIVHGPARAAAETGSSGAGADSGGAGGAVDLLLPALKPGAYRLRYETQDSFGQAVEAVADLLVAPAAGKDGMALPVPALLRIEREQVAVGGTVRLLAASGMSDAPLWLEIYRRGELRELRRLTRGGLIELPVTADDRGGFAVRLSTLRDHQLISESVSVTVPWRRPLSIELSSFRDRLRPGQSERWRVTVRDEQASGAGSEVAAAEVLAYMYDRSLDQLAPHDPPRVPDLFPRYGYLPGFGSNLGAAGASPLSRPRYADGGEPQPLQPDRLTFLDNTGIGGPGRRGGASWNVEGVRMMESSARGMSPSAQKFAQADAASPEAASPAPAPNPPAAEPTTLRSDFAETAFWQPHLITGADGSAAIEFTVPDSVTSWNVWIHALTRDLRSGVRKAQVESVKELIARPYLPRFLRQGDRAELKVAVDNTGGEALTGEVTLEILDPTDEASLTAAFGLDVAAGAGVLAGAARRPFTVAAGTTTTVTFPLTAPRRLGPAAFRVIARSGERSDGELRPLPVLPARFQLVESRFAALAGGESRALTFERMGQDPSQETEQLVVTVDAQLFQSVLAALPYLVETPYEHVEAQVNRFAATAMLSGLFDRYPQVAALSKELSKRDTQLDAWNPDDPNRRMALEETPWLVRARGGRRDGEGDDGDAALLRVLDPAVARAERSAALARLESAQLPSGAFPWFPGGPPSTYMTVYVLHGLARALEFGGEVPRPMVANAWSYLDRTFRDLEASGLDSTTKDPIVLTFMLYTASSYPDESWLGNALPRPLRLEWLARSFAEWRHQAPYFKALLALTLERSDRGKDAELVLDSILDSARSDPDLGLYWAPEERAWLWYNDTIEGHAFVLTALNEIRADDPRRDGLVQWLFLNKKLNQWNSTRATAEVLAALVRYLETEGTLGAREEVGVTAGNRTTTLEFPPERYTGKSNQIVLPGSELDPQRHETVTVDNRGPNRVFASATWHYSTETLPAAGASDLFAIERSYFRRVKTGEETVLEPLAEGATVALGDEVEVQLEVSGRHAAEYVHLRDPRPAGFEPTAARSGWQWDLGLARYEQIRDSGTDFFMEWMPAGTYTLRYRLRAATAGTFQSAPAQLQSLYAPEFAAYSAGATMAITER